MRSVLVLAYSMATLVACGGGKPAASPGGDGTTRVTRFVLAPDAFKVDKVGGSDGSLDPNGVPDAVFDVGLDGPAIGVVLLANDANNKPVGQWDTLTGSDKFPEGSGLYSSHGDSTPGLVLEEKGQRLNHNDGSISPLSGHHDVTMYAEIADVDAAKSLDLILVTAEGRLVRGAHIPFGGAAPK
ncbi:hypothetical protein LZC95_52945 [Pendulispora brunnea]|uniref:Uncharacterized protein n=1 Tax=Pendulispora brunnea TaxID=2905690 RepID=A0ABZ2K8V1_9BACT